MSAKQCYSTQSHSRVATSPSSVGARLLLGPVHRELIVTGPAATMTAAVEKLAEVMPLKMRPT